MDAGGCEWEWVVCECVWVGVGGVWVGACTYKYICVHKCAHMCVGGRVWV